MLSSSRTLWLTTRIQAKDNKAQRLGSAAQVGGGTLGGSQPECLLALTRLPSIPAHVVASGGRSMNQLRQCRAIQNPVTVRLKRYSNLLGSNSRVFLCVLYERSADDRLERFGQIRCGVPQMRGIVSGRAVFDHSSAEVWGAQLGSMAITVAMSRKTIAGRCLPAAARNTTLGHLWVPGGRSVEAPGSDRSVISGCC
jgi:hypothetical protein